MSRSKNVRSRYQTVPAYVRDRITVRDSGDNARSRDSRGRDKQLMRITVLGIIRDTNESGE